MKKTFLIFLISFLPISANTQDIPRTIGSAQQITAPALQKKQNDPKIIIQETPENIQDNIAATAPIQTPANANIPYALNQQRFFENQVTLLIPSTFVNADEELIKAQYPDAANLPKVVLSDSSKRPLLAINLAPKYNDGQDLVHFFRDIKNDLQTKFPKARFLRADVIKARSLGIIEIVLPNKDGKNLYNMMAFRYVGNNFLFVNFTCPEEDMPTWQDSARMIAENIKVLSN